VKGLCKNLAVTVRGSSFEDAKKNMAGELQVHIEKILREHSRRNAQATRLSQGFATISRTDSCSDLS